jgi:hypothetical protein
MSQSRIDRITVGVIACCLMAFFAVAMRGDVRWMLAAGAVAGVWATYRADWTLPPKHLRAMG